MRPFVTPKKHRITYGLILLLLLTVLPTQGQADITAPKKHFGFNIGDDYCLASYSQLVSYWKTLAQESDRMTLEQIGVTEEGRPMWMTIITSPANHNNLDRFRDISRRLALAENLTDAQAQELAVAGKAVVWIDGGLHATEVVGAQQEIELVYQMVSRSDPETLRILDNVILLASISNPDGMELVSNWYMRQEDPEKRSTRGIPRLYQKYVGHDNNRDFYMVTQKETEAVNRILYRVWFPQIVYNHHQTGPAGAVLFAPPFREPHSYNFDPLLVLSITTVGNAMHSRFAAEGKPGAVMGDGAGYQTWWNGCLRCTPYFHNMVGILTEMIGNPTPMEVPFIPQKHLPSGNYPFPIAPQKWHFRQSIDYSQSANRSILDLAAKLRENFLFNIYRMGKNSIERGSRNHWTINPRRIEAVQAAVKKDNPKMTGSGRSRGYPVEYYNDVLHDPKAKDPRGYILPSNQPDFLTAGKFINTLIKNGVTVHRATSSFRVAGKNYPQGSYVVKTAQAFRPHIIDMFEPQFYPDEAAFPGGAPRPPYDSAGYTLALTMGIEFDRILEGFEGPFEPIPDVVSPSPGRINGGGTTGYLLSHEVNDAFIAVNRLLKAGETVLWYKDPLEVAGKAYSAGTFYIPSGAATQTRIQELAGDVGLDFEAVRLVPAGETFSLESPRIGLWDRYGGSMSSGWVRWILEQFEFDFELVYPQALDSGRLEEKYDVLIFVSGAIPAGTGATTSRGGGSENQDPETIPKEFHHMLGRVTVNNTLPQLKSFLEKGGTIITMGSSTRLSNHLGLPVEDALTERTEEGRTRSLPMDKFYIPGSILQIHVEKQHPLAHGMPETVDVYFNRSPVFRLLPEAPSADINPVLWFTPDTTLRSGLAKGLHYLDGGIAAFEARVGKGKLFQFGPEITFRGQPHSTFKLLFNGIFYGKAKTTIGSQ